jgi:hypothetical protein
MRDFASTKCVRDFMSVFLSISRFKWKGVDEMKRANGIE